MGYDPTIGVWFERDPAKVGTNLNEYVGGAPTEFVDPVGAAGVSTTQPRPSPTKPPSTTQPEFPLPPQGTGLRLVPGEEAIPITQMRKVALNGKNYWIDLVFRGIQEETEYRDNKGELNSKEANAKGIQRVGIAWDLTFTPSYGFVNDSYMCSDGRKIKYHVKQELRRVVQYWDKGALVHEEKAYGIDNKNGGKTGSANQPKWRDGVNQTIIDSSLNMVKLEMNDTPSFPNYYRIPASGKKSIDQWFAHDKMVASDWFTVSVWKEEISEDGKTTTEPVKISDVAFHFLLTYDKTKPVEKRWALFFEQRK